MFGKIKNEDQPDNGPGMKYAGYATLQASLVVSGKMTIDPNKEILQYILLQDQPAVAHNSQIGVSFDNLYRAIMILSDVGYVPDPIAVDNKTAYTLLRLKPATK